MVNFQCQRSIELLEIIIGDVRIVWGVQISNHFRSHFERLWLIEIVALVIIGFRSYATLCRKIIYSASNILSLEFIFGILCKLEEIE